MLEQVVRRNRVRAVALALLAGLDTWLVVSLLVGAALWLARTTIVRGPHRRPSGRSPRRATRRRDP